MIELKINDVIKHKTWKDEKSFKITSLTKDINYEYYVVIGETNNFQSDVLYHITFKDLADGEWVLVTKNKCASCTKCECGSDKVGNPYHSSWCPKNKCGCH
jgi:hypothetical protein